MLGNAKANHNRFRSDLAEIKNRNPPKNQKDHLQKNALFNINMLYKLRKAVVKCCDDYSSMASKSLSKSIEGTGLKKILILKHASKITNSSCTSIGGNNSENSLN